MMGYIVCFKYLLPFPESTFHLGPFVQEDYTSNPINVTLGHVSCYGQWNVRSDTSHFEAKSLRNSVLSAVIVKMCYQLFE